MKQNVIVLDTKYRAAASIIRELGRAHYNVITPFIGSAIPVSARSVHVSERFTFVGNESNTLHEGYDALLTLARERDAVILPAGANSTAALAARRDETSPFTLVSTTETLQRANDKLAVAQLARELNIRTPISLNHADADAFRYPVIVKYVNGEALGLVAADRYAIARSRAEYDAALSRMSAGETFVSEYVEGSGYGVSVLMDRNRRAVRVFCHERLREYPLSGGPSVMCRSVWHESMARDAVRLLQALDFEGLAMVEFKGTPSNYALLEINPRIWGSYPLAYLSGAAFADAFVRAARGETLPDALAEREPQYKTGVRMQYFLSGARWAIAKAKQDNSPLPIVQYATDILNPTVRHGLWQWRDPLPALYYLRDLRSR